MTRRPDLPRDPMRIGYVVWRFPKLSETFVRREIETLERLGWRIDVFAFATPAEAVLQPEAARWLERRSEPDTPLAVAAANLAWLGESPGPLLSLYLLIVRELWREPGELARGLVALARAGLWARQARLRGIAHVHAHFARHPAVAALAVAHLAGITCSFTGHSHDVYRHPAMLATKVRRARFVVVVSHLLRDRYIAPCVPPDDLPKVHVVRCGVETAACEPRRREDGPRPLTLLAVARLIEVKGTAFLIEACRLLVARGHDLRCAIVGDGPLRPTLQRQIDAAGLAGHVDLCGAQPYAGVRQALRHATVFVLPSIVTADGTMEGVPVSLMEAMGMGVPVVATRSGAVPELVVHEQTGLLVDPGDARALADAIARLADDDALVRRLADAARRYVQAEFDLQSNVMALHRLLFDAARAQSDPRLPGKD